MGLDYSKRSRETKAGGQVHMCWKLTVQVGVLWVNFRVENDIYEQTSNKNLLTWKLQAQNPAIATALFRTFTNKRVFFPLGGLFYHWHCLECQPLVISSRHNLGAFQYCFKKCLQTTHLYCLCPEPELMCFLTAEGWQERSPGTRAPPAIVWDLMTGGQIQAKNKKGTLKEFVFDLPRGCETE